MKKLLYILPLLFAISSYGQRAIKVQSIGGSTLTPPNTIKKYVNGYNNYVSLGSDSMTEQSTNLFFTNARARGAVSITTTGTSGAATYNNSTGVFNIPQYAGTTYTATSPITLTGSAFGMVNQGTTTTLLHGNASGNPSFGAIVNADITNSTIDLTSKVTGLLPVANGGTGTATPGIVAGANITVTGTWPNQTINSSGGGSGWSLTGNASVDTTVNFLGTTDSKVLYLKTKGIRALTIDTLQKVHIGNIPFPLIPLDSAMLQVQSQGISIRRAGASNTINGMTLKMDYTTSQFLMDGHNSNIVYRESGVDLFKVTTGGVGTFSTSVGAPQLIGMATSGVSLDCFTAGTGASTVFLSNNVIIGGTGKLLSNNGSSPTTSAIKFNLWNGVSAYADRWVMFQNGHFGNATTDVAGAAVNIASTTEGVLLPRMTTTQKNAISSPPEGLEVYDLTLHQKSYYNGTTWINY